MKWVTVWAAMVFTIPCMAQEVPPAAHVALGGPRFLRSAAPNATPIDPGTVPVLQRRVTLTGAQATLGAALQAITVQTGVQFLLSRDVVPTTARVQVNATRLSLAAALTELLLHAGLDVIVVSPKALGLVRRGAGLRLEVGAILGRVTDSKTREGVADAEVFLEGTRWRTVTDSAGRYVLADVDVATYTLVARRLGYTKQSRKVTVREGQVDTIDLTLATAAVKLDELVTTATGPQRRRDLGNAITTIRADSVLQTAPIRNLSDILENRVPGLTTQHISGAPGDPSRMRIRGLGSVYRSNDPVFIVDGVRVYAAQAERRSGNLANEAFIAVVPNNNASKMMQQATPAPSPLDQIDPNIIETIEVFKGPSAATLYGPDAANGVIVITTKKGRPGPTHWNTSMRHGLTELPGGYPESYYRWGHSEFDNIPRLCTIVELTCRQDSLIRYQALNDPALTILERGQLTAVSLTASGGNQALTYNITASYDDERGYLRLPELEIDRFRATFGREAPDWMREPHHLKKWSVASNVTASLGASANVTLTAGVSRSEQQRTSLENLLPQLATTYVDRVNKLYYSPSLVLGVGSPLGQAMAASETFLESYYTRRTASSINFTTGISATWRPVSWFNAQGTAGINVIPREDEVFMPSGLLTPNDSGSIAHGSGRSVVSTLNVNGTVRKSLGWGGFDFETSLGANLNTNTTTDLIGSARGLSPGVGGLGNISNLNTSRFLQGAQSNTSIFGWYVEPRLVGRRLSFSTGLRLDGGSAYGARVSSGGFKLPKLNGSWVISEEPFFPLKSLFSSFRLRGAYGQSQVQPGAADRLRLYTYNALGPTSMAGLRSLGNTELRPERSLEFEGGFDADLLDSRLSLELTAYRKTQVDALMPLQLPQSVNGGGTVIQNVGTIRNTGLELALTMTPVQTPVLTWNATLMYAKNTNTLVKLGRGVRPDSTNGIVEGYPVRGRWALPILGYSDQNGNNVLDPGEIQIGSAPVFMGQLLPDYKTTLFTNVALFGGSVSISAGFDYESGATQVDQRIRQGWPLVRGLSDPNTPLGQQAVAIAAIASTGSQNQFNITSTDYGLIQDVSTFRFNSLAVNYRVPGHVVRLLRAQQLTVSVRGANLGLHSTYTGKDPDVTSWSQGENIRDTGQIPLPRTWEFALFLQY